MTYGRVSGWYEGQIHFKAYKTCRYEFHCYQRMVWVNTWSDKLWTRDIIYIQTKTVLCGTRYQITS